MGYLKSLFKILSIVLLGFASIIFLLIGYFNYSLPDYYYVDEGSELEFSSFSVGSINSISSVSVSYSDSYSDSNSFYCLKFMGVFPIKQVEVEKTPQVYLAPSGEAFGLKMFTKGAIVVGLEVIPTSQGEQSPWAGKDIQVGDIVVEANNKEVNRNSELALIVESSQGQEVSLKILRGDEYIDISITPVLCESDNAYKTGIWVRDSTAGIGTITYIDEQNNSFAGLGHGICDVDTGQIMPVGSGEVCDVSITNISKGSAGNPGELMGVFTSETPFGSILLNNETGIYGTLNESFFDSSYNQEQYLLAHKQDVVVGEATILCCFDGVNTVEYDILIESIDYNEDSEVKNLSIKVTDEELLQLTGGIVQGMSGTPIIQNDMLVGAVTHVFVSDSSKGYGIFAENMYYYSSDIEDTTSSAKLSA